MPAVAAAAELGRSALREVRAFSHSHDWPLVFLFATLAMLLSHGIVAATGASFLFVLLISLGVVFGIQICLVQIADRFKSQVADRLIGWYLFVCGWALVILLVVGAVLLVVHLFRAEPVAAADGGRDSGSIEIYVARRGRRC